jgi:hypothetical protein
MIGSLVRVSPEEVPGLRKGNWATGHLGNWAIGQLGVGTPVSTQHSFHGIINDSQSPVFLGTSRRASSQIACTKPCSNSNSN